MQLKLISDLSFILHYAYNLVYCNTALR